ncbi:hypothetical protein SDRG_13516 [Saprolegnia diclina VS20]|uniref:J domain-containing protein n=1 Tax=Saprolegnia diclina (strain VS20) TaxID=1156394 RepID=T0Q2Q1_SAPDV|nr:hypothetical protein SDRG_13516 [Saprolegnia diclina VS20]EQC28836.1 hypothetical protein SDRG_13516 [Saprolegnia diclina VS20]|eukprot:XP_008617831.1 hypothetical protein SDRG_13516 [Saprolegnia diclina VS20]
MQKWSTMQAATTLVARVLGRRMASPLAPRRFQMLSTAPCCDRVKAHAHTDQKCWNCGKPNDCCVFFCGTCNHIQPLNPSGACNYFKIFGIPENFSIDPKAVEQLYWSLQKKMHPDLYGHKSETEKELSVTNSAVINTAYNMLKAPTTRANYLLHLHGIDALGDNTTLMDPAILMHIMEAREQVDDCTSVDELEPLKKANATDIEACVVQITSAFDGSHDLESSKRLTVQLQYLMKLAEAIVDKEEELEG